MSLVDIEHAAEVAEMAADQAAEVLMELFGVARVEYKGEIDLVTEADRRAEERIVALINEHFPDHAIVAEESGEHDARDGSKRVCWYIDPIDGTTNYAHGMPIFATSICLSIDGKPELGIVNNPAYNERYTARRGHGAFLNGERIGVSGADTLKKSLLVTGFPYDSHERPANIDHFTHFIQQTRGVRRLGSAALDLAYVARGSLDGYWETKLNPWDYAAGWLLVLEAGGVVTDLKGEPMTFEARQILASNGRIHDAMVQTLKRGKTGLEDLER